MTSDYKVLGQSNPTAANLTDCYTVPASLQAVVSSVLIANRSATPTTFRISVAIAGAADSNEQYIAYDADISGNDVVDFTIGMTLDETDVVRVYATDATLSFNVYGEEIGGSGGGGGFAIGSSYLIADLTAAAGNASGATLAMPLSLVSVAGSDLSINGGDASKVDIATDGWYMIEYEWGVGVTAAAVGWYEFQSSGAAGNFAYLSFSGTVDENDTAGAIYRPLISIPRQFSAGDTVLAHLSVTTADASTWDFEGASGAYRIVRVA